MSTKTLRICARTLAFGLLCGLLYWAWWGVLAWFEAHPVSDGAFVAAVITIALALGAWSLAAGVRE